MLQPGTLIFDMLDMCFVVLLLPSANGANNRYTLSSGDSNGDGEGAALVLHTAVTASSRVGDVFTAWRCDQGPGWDVMFGVVDRSLDDGVGSEEETMGLDLSR